MPLEQRGKQRYYYERKRVNGRITRKYFGRDRRALAMAEVEAERIRARKAELAARKQDEERFQSGAGPTKSFDASLELLTQAILYSHGFHLHAQSQWRKRRGN